MRLDKSAEKSRWCLISHARPILIISETKFIANVLVSDWYKSTLLCEKHINLSNRFFPELHTLPWKLKVWRVSTYHSLSKAFVLSFNLQKVSFIAIKFHLQLFYQFRVYIPWSNVLKQKKAPIHRLFDHIHSKGPRHWVPLKVLCSFKHTIFSLFSLPVLFPHQAFLSCICQKSLVFYDEVHMRCQRWLTEAWSFVPVYDF